MSQPLEQREYRQKASPETMGQRFLKLCQQVGFGQLEVEVANGVPKEVKVIHQNFRIDLTEPTANGTLDSSKRLTT